MNAIDFSGKTVLVVGGTSGIGNGVAQAFRSQGAEVHVWGTRAKDSYKPEDGSDLEGLHFAQVNAADDAAVEAYAPPFDALDVLVCSQGTVVYGRGEFEKDGWDRVMDVNINSVMACARKFHPMLAAAKGAMIIVSSVAGLNATRGNPAYSASKHAAVGLTKTLGEAWASEGIRVNGLAPGLVDTKLTKRSPPKTRNAWRARSGRSRRAGWEHRKTWRACVCSLHRRSPLMSAGRRLSAMAGSRCLSPALRRWR